MWLYQEGVRKMKTPTIVDQLKNLAKKLETSETLPEQFDSVIHDLRDMASRLEMIRYHSPEVHADVGEF